MVKKYFCYLLVSSLYLALPAFAEQVKLATDNQIIHAKVSAKELTHIYVDGDRIANIRGLDGAYELKKDEAQASIFIQPTPAYQQKSFNLFLTTELGHTYPLLLTSIDIPGESIKLKPITPAKAAAERWEMSSSYEQTLVDLIAEMANGSRPEGYAVVAIGKVLPSQPGVLKTVLRYRYLGKHLQGQVLKIINTGNVPIHLTERQFYTDNTRALSLMDDDLEPKQVTYLYRVVNNE
jgi:type-F conjugative transfer system secretin TraK